MTSVADLMRTNLLLLPEQCTAMIAIEALHERDISGAPVVDGQGRAIGMFTVTGLNTRVLQQSRTVLSRPISEIMTPFVFSLRSEDSLSEAMRILVETRIHRVLVRDEEERPLGILTTMDVLKALHKQILQDDDGRIFAADETERLRVLTNDPVSAVMTHPVITIVPDDSLAHFETLTQRHSISATPVVDAARGDMVGLVSQVDVALRLRTTLHSLENSLALDVMTPFAFRLAPEKPLSQALALMVEQHIHRVIVVDDRMVPVGVITALDVFRLGLQRMGFPPGLRSR